MAASQEHDHQILPVQYLKYAMEEENLPESLISVEDDKVQFISEKSALLYPDDNSVLRVDHFSVGGSTFSKSLVLKDNLRFGLRQRKQTAPLPENTQECDFGLVRYKVVGDTEFFLHFENGTKFGLEQVQLERNPRRTVRIEPKPPTAEEIATKLEQKKRLAEATLKA